MPRKCIVCVDFDGVIHQYTSGWKGATVIADGPVEGAFEWLAQMAGDDRFETCIYSSRSKEPGAIEAMKQWFVAYGFREESLAQLSFPTKKPAASMTIDDRAYRFEGKFPRADWILNFKPWNKR